MTNRFLKTLFFTLTIQLIGVNPLWASTSEELVMLGVVSPGEDGYAYFLARGQGNNLSDSWTNEVQKSVEEIKNFKVYNKGRRVGIFSVKSITLEEDIFLVINGGTQFEGKPPSYKFFLPAVSENFYIKDTCKQPTGFDSHKFPIDFDCDKKTDFLQVEMSKDSAVIKLIFGNGKRQAIDTIRGGHIEGKEWNVTIEDILDIDCDGIPEVFATHYKYPVWSLIIYKYDSGHWKRFFEGGWQGD